MTDVGRTSNTASVPQSLLRFAGANLIVGALLVLVGGSTLLWYVGIYLVTSVALAALIVGLRADHALPIAIVVGLVFLAGDAVQRRDLEEPFHQRHDGAVVATEAAARMVLDGQNPYSADFTPRLRPYHHTLDAVNNPIANPLVEHYPYLPTAFLVHAPFVALSDAAGDWYDARMLYVVIVAAAVAIIAAGDLPRFRRAAAIWALVGSTAVAIFLSWGTNDAAAASLVVIGALIAERRPALAGVLLACALSFKVLLVVAFVPLLVLWWVHHRETMRPVLLAGAATALVTSVPFLVASPRDFIEDTILFNLGFTDRSFPVSGFGLGKHFPDLVQGWVLFGLSAVLVLSTSAAAVWWVRRCPHPEVALFAAGIIVFAGLIPARTFQQTYAPLMVILWAPIWRLPAREIWPFAQRHHSTQPLPSPSTS